MKLLFMPLALSKPQVHPLIGSPVDYGKFVLCTEDGERIGNQIKTSLISDGEGPARVVVEFSVGFGVLEIVGQ